MLWLWQLQWSLWSRQTSTVLGFERATESACSRMLLDPLLHSYLPVWRIKPVYHLCDPSRAHALVYVGVHSLIRPAAPPLAFIGVFVHMASPH
jgi:hypothetical protein